MDGRGRCHDNIFIERLWRSLKWELIYLKAFDDGQHLSPGSEYLVSLVQPSAAPSVPELSDARRDLLSSG